MLFRSLIRRRPFFVAFLRLILCAAPLVGCTRHYVPITPRAPFDAAGLRVRVVGLDRYDRSTRHVRTGTRVRIEVEDAPQDILLNGALFTSALSLPCAEGDAPTSVALEDATNPIGSSLTPHSRIAFRASEWHFLRLVASQRKRRNGCYAGGGGPLVGV